MKLSTRVSMSAVSLLTALMLPIRPAAQEHSAAQHQPGGPRYVVTDVGSFTPNVIADNGVVAGLDTAPDGTQHAVLWVPGTKSEHRQTRTRRTE